MQIKLRVAPILAGFLTMSGLYTVNLAIQEGAPNLSLLRTNKPIPLNWWRRCLLPAPSA
ncbi:MAG: hypothetical protein PUH08_00400 [Treponema sp.]|nr:hypothetical protein [Treponema sp.]